MIAQFFLDRKVLAGTLSLLLLLLGVLSLTNLPVEQYPQITPPTIRVTTVYPGASAQVVADTVAAPIEQQVNGVERMLYMSSTSAGDGTYSLTVTFDIDTDLDKAQTLIQNRLTIAEAQLPEEVRRQGLVVTKQTAGVLMVVSLTSDDPEHGELFLANYAALRIRDELARVSGVGEVQVYGAGAYSMRVWLDPDKLHAYSLTPQDVVRALSEQNVHAAAGQIGQPPTAGNSPFQLSVTAVGRLADPADFERVIVKTGTDSRTVFLKDIAKVELGGMSYDTFTRHEGRDAAAILIYQDGLAFEEQRVGGQYIVVFAFALTMVFIVLAPLYESWFLPFAVLLTTPLGLLGVACAALYARIEFNVYVQIGAVLIVALASKNAILIVEFARELRLEGMSIADAAIEAAKERLRPVLMTSIAFIAGVVPLVLAEGAGAASRQSLGIAVFGGMITSTVLAVFFVPVAYVVAQRIDEMFKKRGDIRWGPAFCSVFKAARRAAYQVFAVR